MQRLEGELNLFPLRLAGLVGIEQRITRFAVEMKPQISLIFKNAEDS